MWWVCVCTVLKSVGFTSQDGRVHATQLQSRDGFTKPRPHQGGAGGFRSPFAFSLHVRARAARSSEVEVWPLSTQMSEHSEKNRHLDLEYGKSTSVFAQRGALYAQTIIPSMCAHL